jgi:hypothetical protein
VLLAAAGVGTALAARPSTLPPARFEDTGLPLFQGFEDPTLATSLSVVEWDDKAAKLRRFQVEQKQGRWVIPSHHDYPADGTERMGKAAASLVGVLRDIYYGDNPAEHGTFGVLDPEDAAGGGAEKGRHITVKDSGGAVLADVIVGKEIADKQGFRYVRLAGDKRVYGARMELDISTDFAQWIEKDLLGIERDDVVAVDYDPYTVDEAVGRVVGTDPLHFRRAEGPPDDSGGATKPTWQLAETSKVPAGKIVDDAKLTQIVGAVDRLQIVGVRPRPERLTLQALQSKGFFVNTGTGRLFGNEGEIHVADADGVVISLFFGEVTAESGLALTSGTEEAGAEAAGGAGSNRFLWVDVGFDPARVLAAGNADEGKKRAETLRSRFGGWFYVIADSSFQQIHKARDELFKAKK